MYRGKTLTHDYECMYVGYRKHIYVSMLAHALSGARATRINTQNECMYYLVCVHVHTSSDRLYVCM